MGIHEHFEKSMYNSKKSTWKKSLKIGRKKSRGTAIFLTAQSMKMKKYRTQQMRNRILLRQMNTSRRNSKLEKKNADENQTTFDTFNKTYTNHIKTKLKKTPFPIDGGKAIEKNDWKPLFPIPVVWLERCCAAWPFNINIVTIKHTKTVYHRQQRGYSFWFLKETT